MISNSFAHLASNFSIFLHRWEKLIELIKPGVFALQRQNTNHPADSTENSELRIGQQIVASPNFANFDFELSSQIQKCNIAFLSCKRIGTFPHKQCSGVEGCVAFLVSDNILTIFQYWSLIVSIRQTGAARRGDIEWSSYDNWQRAAHRLLAVQHHTPLT